MGKLPNAAGSWRRGVSLFLLLIPFIAFAPIGYAQAKEPFKQGETLPDLVLAVPGEASQAAYLGLQSEKGQTFRIGQIKQPWVLIEVFNMYCTICQGEAEKVNRLYEKISQGPLNDKLAVIGIGVGNSPFEVKVFRNRYRIKFPLFADGDFKLHKLLKEPRTPYFLLVRVREPSLRIALTNLGAFGQVPDFLADLEKTMK